MGYLTRRQQPQAPSTQVQPDQAAGTLQPYGNAASAEELGSYPFTEPTSLLEEVEATRRPIGPQTKEEALGNRRYDLRAVADLLERGRRLSPTNPEEKLLKNSIEWIDTGLCKLVVLSPTHDAHRRKLGPDEVSYFDHRVVYPNEGADYETRSDAGITVARKSIVGIFDPSTDTMYLYSPGNQDPAEVEATLVHEIQHDADDAGKGERWAVPPQGDADAHEPAPAWAWNHYQSEFRAYWLEPDTELPSEESPASSFRVEAVDQGKDGRTGTDDDVRSQVTTGFANSRQEAIFSHLWHLVPDDVYWNVRERRWTAPNAYLPHYYVFDPNFRQMVDDFDVPSGGNLLNSPRIELLARAIEEMDWSAIEAAANALDFADKKFLSDPERSEPFWRGATGAKVEVRHRIEELIGAEAA
jgi:hypothetical protein